MFGRPVVLFLGGTDPTGPGKGVCIAAQEEPSQQLITHASGVAVFALGFTSPWLRQQVEPHTLVYLSETGDPAFLHFHMKVLGCVIARESFWMN